MSDHLVKLTDDQKVKWFDSMVRERDRAVGFKNRDEFQEFIKDLRRAFKIIYKRDVPGSFISRLMARYGFGRKHSDKVDLKKEYLTRLWDENAAYRDNKSQSRKSVEDKFGESILSMVFDEIWDEYHAQEDHPVPAKNVDYYGQGSIFTE